MKTRLLIRCRFYSNRSFTLTFTSGDERVKTADMVRLSVWRCLCELWKESSVPVFGTVNESIWIQLSCIPHDEENQTGTSRKWGQLQDRPGRAVTREEESQRLVRSTCSRFTAGHLIKFSSYCLVSERSVGTQIHPAVIPSAFTPYRGQYPPITAESLHSEFILIM